jgi:hypothetical protein
MLLTKDRFLTMTSSLLQEQINKIRQEVLFNPVNPSLWLEIGRLTGDARLDRLSSEGLLDSLIDESYNIASANHRDTDEEDLSTVNLLIEECLDGYRKHDLRRLESSIDKLISIAPGNPWTFAIQGFFHTFKKDYKTSKLFLEQAVEIDPSNSWFRLWICENAIITRDVETLVTHGDSLSIDENNTRMMFISLISYSLKILLDNQRIASQNLVYHYKTILLDLANGDESYIEKVYITVIRGIEDRLNNLAVGPDSSRDIILILHELRVKIMRLMQSI